MISLITFLYVYFLTKKLVVTSIFALGLKGILVGVTSILGTAFFLSFMDEFEFLKNKIFPVKIRRFINKKSIGICIIIISFIVIISSNI